MDAQSEQQVFAYLRVSGNKQEVDAQKYGLLLYANEKKFRQPEIIEETIQRTKSWKTRKLGQILQRAKAGDIILVPEYTRLAGSPIGVFSFLSECLERSIEVHITKMNHVFDGSLNSQMMAMCFSMASQIEIQFLSLRTKEGMAVAKAKGVHCGRPQGSKGKLKLDGHEDEIQDQLNKGVSVRRIASNFSCTPIAVNNLIVRKGLYNPRRAVMKTEGYPG